jgi:hypothetical protein
MKDKLRHPNHESNANLQHDPAGTRNDNGGLTGTEKDRHGRGLGGTSNQPPLRPADDTDDSLEERNGSRSEFNLQPMQSEQMDKLGDQAPETEGEDDLYTFRYLRYLSKRAGIPVQESVYSKSPAKNLRTSCMK